MGACRARSPRTLHGRSSHTEPSAPSSDSHRRLIPLSAHRAPPMATTSHSTRYVASSAPRAPKFIFTHFEVPTASSSSPSPPPTSPPPNNPSKRRRASVDDRERSPEHELSAEKPGRRRKACVQCAQAGVGSECSTNRRTIGCRRCNAQRLGCSFLGGEHPHLRVEVVIHIPSGVTAAAEDLRVPNLVRSLDHSLDVVLNHSRVVLETLHDLERRIAVVENHVSDLRYTLVARLPTPPPNPSRQPPSVDRLSSPSACLSSLPTECIPQAPPCKSVTVMDPVERPPDSISVSVSPCRPQTSQSHFCPDPKPPLVSAPHVRDIATTTPPMGG